MSQEELYGNDKFEKMQQTLKELLIQSENLDRNYQNLLNDLSLSENQLTQFMDNPGNFSSEEWSELESEKEKMQAMLEQQLSNVKDPKKTRKKYSQQKRVKNDWIFVR